MPDNETFRFGPGAVKKSSRAFIFPIAVGQNAFLLRASLLDEEVPLLISMGVVTQLGNVIDAREKTIEFRNFQNAQVPLEVVAGHLTMDLKPKHASALQKQLTSQMWEQARQRQEATILRPSSENIGLDSSSITHPVATTATPRKDADHHQTDTAHGQMDVSSFHFHARSLPHHLAYGVYWRSRAGDLLPVRRWKRRPVDALAHRMRHEDDVSIMVSGTADFGEKGRPQEGGTAPIGSAGTPTRGGRTSARSKGTDYGTEHPNRPAPGQGGVDSRTAALMRETDRNRIGTEQNEFPETPVAFDGRGHSSGLRCAEDVGDKFLRFLGSWRRRTTLPNPVSNVGTPKGDGLSKRSTPLTLN